MASNRIALDVMGGDDAPEAPLRGALLACSPDATGACLKVERVLLVGPRERIEQRLAELGGNPGFAIEDADQVIGMGESPATALRSKPNSSIARGMQAVRGGAAGAFVGMGNTGATVGAATLSLGTLPGVRRPGIAVTLDLTGHPITDALALIVPFYGFVEAWSRARGLDPDKPVNLKKVTETR